MERKESLYNLLGDRVWPATVEDTNDPLRSGRIKARVKYLFDDIETEDLPWSSPWKSLHGRDFITPEKGKIVNVLFFNGDINSPEYFSTEHFDINLQKKLEELSEDDYKTFGALYYDKDLRIFKIESEGYTLDYKNTKIKISEQSDMTLQLKDNKSQLNLGDVDATQKALLTDHFFEWMSTFLAALKDNAYIGNLGVPVITGPTLMTAISQFNDLKDTFMSKHVFIVDNDSVSPQTDKYSTQEGDAIKSYENETVLDIKNEDLVKGIKVVEVPKEDNITYGIDDEDISSTDTTSYSAETKPSDINADIYIPVKYERQHNIIGCLATSISMAINYLKGKAITSESDILENYADSNNNINFHTVVKSFGNKSKKISYTEDNITETVKTLLNKNKKPVIIKVRSVSKPNNTSKQHYVLGIGVTSDNRIIIHDPNRGRDNIILDTKRLHPSGYIGTIL